LLVEDDLSLAQTLAAALEPTAIPVEHCVSAELAIEMVAAKEYAVVVVELVPSSGDGASGGYVVRALRKLPKEKRPAAIMLASGSATLRGIDRTSIASLLFKPLDIPLFVEYVTATYRRRLCAEEPAVAAAAEIPPPR
jgi:DNA-binding response OmpR family regulator